MITITDQDRENINEKLHDEIVQQVKEGDTTVLFEIIEGLNHTTAFYSLSDDAMQELNLKKNENQKIGQSTII